MIKLLRLEALAAALALAIYLYQLAPSPWLVVLVLILPDLSMLGYMAGAKLGARVYNAVHSVIGPDRKSVV